MFAGTIKPFKNRAKKNFLKSEKFGALKTLSFENSHILQLTILLLRPNLFLCNQYAILLL